MQGMQEQLRTEKQTAQKMQQTLDGETTKNQSDNKKLCLEITKLKVCYFNRVSWNVCVRMCRINYAIAIHHLLKLSRRLKRFKHNWKSNMSPQRLMQDY